MDRNEIETLAQTVEAGAKGGTQGVDLALRDAFPEAELDRSAADRLLSSADAALHAVDAALPGWEVTLKGVAREPDGHWTCTLRRSGADDDDEVIGVGRAPTVAQALLAAVLKVGARRMR